VKGAFHALKEGISIKDLRKGFKWSKKWSSNK